MRKRLFIIACRNDLLTTDKNKKLFSEFFDDKNLETFKKNMSMSVYIGRNFEKEFANTIRCGGRHSPLKDKHNWDGYIVDGNEYRLTLQDTLKLQGFQENFELCGSDSKKWKQLGNTIPTIFTQIVGHLIKNFLTHLLSDQN